MARIVLGIGTSHTPMLNTSPQDWPRFVERDRLRPHLDEAGDPASFEALATRNGDRLAGELTPQVMAERHARAMKELDRLSAAIREARLDALVIVGDDQKEIFDTANQPAILVYHGSAIPNVPLRDHPGPTWAREASARYYEPQVPKAYPVDTRLADHLIATLMARDFDVAVADRMRPGEGEGHAFGFVHRRLLDGGDLPVVPVFLNTFFPPNQPSPKRCHDLGRVIRDAVAAYPGDARIGVVASGGLSHFTVDEALDARIIAALRAKDAAALHALPPKLLQAGSSEIRNWICMAGATDHLALRSLEYIPGYRTLAGTGTGLCFAVWS